jgi:hypothetical protein
MDVGERHPAARWMPPNRLAYCMIPGIAFCTLAARFGSVICYQRSM